MVLNIKKSHMRMARCVYRPILLPNREQTNNINLHVVVFLFPRNLRKRDYKKAFCLKKAMDAQKCRRNSSSVWRKDLVTKCNKTLCPPYISIFQYGQCPAFMVNSANQQQNQHTRRTNSLRRL